MTSKNKFSSEFKIGKTTISSQGEPYFIADIGANHNGNLNKAIELINLAANAGANAVKFQHFKADTIVSKYGFETLTDVKSHQKNWKKTVFEVYQDASINLDWTQSLMDEAKVAGVEFFTSPYSLDLVDYVDQYVSAYKVGSGDITWQDIIDKMASKGKPILLACGASTLDEVDRAIQQALSHTGEIVIMQCNTNYTASLENFKYINLNVIKTFRTMYPTAILGLSDHTPGHSTTLGAIALGANVIEKHFTDNNNNEGPDHKFAMNPNSWNEMVERSKELYLSLGSSIKKVEDNEKDTVIVQRRSIRLRNEVKIGDILKADNLECLRPSPEDSIAPYYLSEVIGKKSLENIPAGEYIKWHQIK
ncbi:N-acetylneuraminate synthase family protein [Shewanella metallivivens]|uniref:N-acetylneuraminate synthase family protein n=1 Tax=Shewanella metallivivens TaxID=2872342 RepID=A0ABT5TJ71_9GAMM|nr:N-acetylneuraminate synthase family protein [Shewanella metallivivens]MDD8058642.1 N-acetylneuraminate synthase family protein [Shewanella metallivivens]